MFAMIRAVCAAAILFLCSAVQAQDADFNAELSAIQQAWAVANYGIADDGAKKKAFEELNDRVAVWVARYPQRAEPLIWQGIVLSTYAGVKGGLGALGLAKKSRAALERALSIDPQALEGSAYTSLGALYSKVPGFPVGFGDDGKAREFLQKALAVNPDGLDANFFYGEFLADQHRYAEARTFLERALSAPPRPNRELADRGRHEEITALLARLREKAG
jgi:tetratricopeptide (TPR) repeat protein